MGKVELCLVEKTPTAKEGRGRSREPIRTIASRTPSPSPSRSACRLLVFMMPFPPRRPSLRE
eukprot:5807260-Amphidinium_carterae.1